MFNKYKDIIAGGFLFAIGIIMFFASFNIKVVAGMTVGIGSDFMPKIGAIILAFLGATILILGFKKIKNTDLSQENTTVNTNHKRLAVVAFSLVSIALYIFLINILGFMISTALYIFAQITLLAPKGKVNYLLFTVVSLIVSSSIYYTFVKAFDLMLPAGILG